MWVERLPEEEVRQNCIQNLLRLSYPKRYIAVELSVKKASFDPRSAKRRIDIAVFCTLKGDMYPLLLIECKDTLPKESLAEEKALRQLTGYNAEMKAPFLGLVSKEGISVYWNEQKKRRQTPYLPTFQELVQAWQSLS